jgi:hypothetical protein
MKLDGVVFKKWISWANDIRKDLMNIVDNQQTFLAFSEVVQANWEHIKQYNGIRFCYFVRTCYGVQAAMGIRRHLKTNPDSISLLQLIEQIAKCANQFTYDFYISQYPIDKTYVNWQEGTFSQFSHDGKVISEDIIEADLKKASGLGEQIETFVDRTLAHLDRRGWDGRVTYEDLELMIKRFDELACKYLALITTEGYSTLKPSIQYDWKAIFRVPLDIRK